jgi:hypothetical protein
MPMRAAILPTMALLTITSAAPSCSRTWDDPGPDGGTVLPPALIGIGVTPMNPKVTLGEELQLVATGFYNDQRTVQITDSVTWSSSDPTVLAVEGGLDREGIGTTLGAGRAIVTASYFEIESNVTVVTVTEALVEELVVQPASVQVHVGESVQMVAEAAFSDGSRGNVSGGVRWVTDDGAIAQFSDGGLLTGTGVGSTAVRAIYEQGDGELASEPIAVDVVGDDVVLDRADLRIVSVNAIANGDALDWQVSVRNSGGAPASGFWLDAWLNRTAAPPPPPTGGDASSYVDVIEPGDTREVSVSLSGVTPGTFPTWLLADALGGVAEGASGENNNVFGPYTVTVTGADGPVGADLAVTWFTAFVQPEQDRVVYVIDVTNSGDEPSSEAALGLFANPAFPPEAPAVPDEVATVPALLPGETVTESIEIRALPDTLWQSWALIDSDAAISEPNEANNLTGVSVVP